jgi:signal transduction histidine kinase
LLIAASSNGLYILKDGKLVQHFTEANGMSNDLCNRIMMEGMFCFVSTSNGLNIFQKKDDLYKLTGILTTANGLMSNSINDVAVNNGKLYIATDKGLTIMNWEIPLSSRYNGKVIITAVITDTLQRPINGKYIFPDGIPRLLIRFAYPVFNQPQQSKIMHRLIRNNDENIPWVTSPNNEIEFSSLSPGDYIIELAPDLKTVSGKPVTKLYFEIQPSWWQTTTAKSIFSAVFLGLIIFAVRRIVSKRYENRIKQQLLIENERNRIASDMHDDIGSDLTQINIWSNILKTSGNNQSGVAAKISRSSNDVLEKMDQIIWALNSSHDHSGDLVTYLHEYASQYLENANINLTFRMEEAVHDFKISATQKRNIFLVLKELLHNTVKHSNAKNVILKIQTSESALKIHYKDNGRGYETNEIKEGVGFSSMRERMKEINGFFSSYSEKGEGVVVEIAISAE